MPEESTTPTPDAPTAGPEQPPVRHWPLIWKLMAALGFACLWVLLMAKDAIASSPT